MKTRYTKFTLKNKEFIYHEGDSLNNPNFLYRIFVATVSPSFAFNVRN